MKNTLKFVDIFIGSRCNLACFQCDTRSDIIRTSLYDPDITSIKESFDLVYKNFDVDYYTLLGGEPLLYIEKIKTILSYIRSKDKTVKIIIPTNATVLKKRFKEIGELLIEFNVNLAICNHFSGFENKDRSNEIRKVSKEFVEYLNLDQVDRNTFFTKLLDLKNTRQDPYLEEFLKRKGPSELDESNEIYANDNFFVWIRDQDTFQSNYQIENGKPKPFDSSDIWGSYINGCCGAMCSFLINKKLYKCAALGTLEKLLTHHDSMSDPVWQKYINYKPLDLENLSEEDSRKFSENVYRPISECTMCSSVSKEFTKTEKTVFPIKVVK